MAKKFVFALVLLAVLLTLTASSYQANRVDYLQVSGSYIVQREDGLYYLSISGAYNTSCAGREVIKFVNTRRGQTLQIYKASVVRKGDLAYCGVYTPGLIDQAQGCGCTTQYVQYVIPIY